MSTSTYETINAKDKPIAEDFVYVYSEIEDGGFRKVSKAMLKVLLGVATKLSELENDKEFITKTVSDLENYYLKSETYSKDEIDNRISLIPRFNVQVVSSLPTTDISETTVYLVSSGDDSDNLYTEYINVNGLWEILGTQKIASVENAVLYTAQSLTDEEKTQARTNIGAISLEDIPKSLPANDVYSWAKEPKKPSYTASEVGALSDTIKIPTNTSDLTNDSGYITKAVNNLANYYLKSQTYSSEEIDNKISSIPKFSIEVVESLPTSNISTTTVYLLKSGEETDNLYTEYIRVNGKWEYLGKQTLDLSGYVKKTELSDYYTKTEMGSLLETIRNSIPTKLSQMTADETHRTVTDVEKQTWNNKSNFSGNYDDLTNKPSIPSLTGYAKESYVQEYAQPKGSYATNEKVSKLESQIADYITPEIPSFWEDSVNSVIATIKALQKDGGKDCITFPFFSDNHQRNGYAGILIKKVMDECYIPYCFFGGDSTSSGYIETDEELLRQDTIFDEMMSVVPDGRFCRTVGNHDGYMIRTDGNNVQYTREQIYDLFMRQYSVYQNKHYGGDGTYYYVDDLAGKIRFILLNTASYNIETEQLTWLQNVALKFNESGWGVVFISHQPISNHYHSSISNAQAVRTIVKNYIDGTAENKADIIGWFSGHIHRDRIYTGIATNTSDDTEGEAMGFTQVTITSDHTGIAYDDATKHTVANDNLSHAIDFVTINKKTKIVNLTRLGIGNNRVYSYTESVQLYSITNNLSNVTNNNIKTSIEENGSYSATISANTGYELESVVVTMGGVDVTSSVYVNGVITISEVTGNVVITASATKIEVDEPSTGYTNQIPISTDANGNIYNSIGYKPDSYLSSSSGDVSSSAKTGYGTTGFIPIGVGSSNIATGEQVIYLKNIEGLSNDSNMRIWFYDSSKTKIAYQGAHSFQTSVGSGSYIAYTLGDDGYIDSLDVSACTHLIKNNNNMIPAFFRICAKGLDGESIITVNEPITDGDSTTTIPITWKSGYKCSYAVGSECTISADTNYTITEEIDVEYGKTYEYTTTQSGLNNAGIKWVGINDSGVVTETSDSAVMTTGTYTETWTPTKATTTKLRLRTYTGLNTNDLSKLKAY